MAFLLVLVTLCQSFLFKQDGGKAYNLYEITTDFYTATTNIECGALCLLHTSHHACTVFSLNSSNNSCTCGKGSLNAVVNEHISELTFHVGAECKTGNNQRQNTREDSVGF